MMRYVIAVLVLLAASIARAEGPTTQPFVCAWATSPITIDGKGDDAAWANAPWVDDFRAWWLPADQQKAKTRTRAKLLWDADYLYFFAEMEDHDLYTPTKDHQGWVWLGDVFELFLKPAADKPAYYEFEVNPANATLELFLPSRGAGGFARFAALTKVEMKTAVQLKGTLNDASDRDEGWSCEGRIKWADLAATGAKPKAGDVWHFSFCRGDTSVGLEQKDLTSSAPLTKDDFHHYEDYSPLKFEGSMERDRK